LDRPFGACNHAAFLLTLRPYAIGLSALLALFLLRVAAQLLIAFGFGGFLPPWEEWFSGLVPYPQLLASQIVIIAICGKICADFWRARGLSVEPRRWLGSLLLVAGSVYLSVMVIRYAIRMALYPPERWTGGSIPIFFHWVLAGFILVLAVYHRRSAPSFPPSRHPIRARLARLAGGVAIVGAVSGWMAYLLAPAILARVLDARQPENAVRVERGVAMLTSDGVTLVADVYHPLRVRVSPTILVRIPFSRTIVNSLFATVIGRFWAEHGYTVVIQGTRGRYESGGRHDPLVDERRDGLDTLAWLQQQSWFDGRVGMWGGSAFGYTEWAIADRLPSPPAGRSALMVQICSTSFHDMFYPGGAFSLSSALFWAVRSRGAEDETPGPDALQRGYAGFPLVKADERAAGDDIRFFNDWVEHQTADGYWRAIDGDDRARTLQAPVMLAAGWFDPFLPGQLADFIRIRRDARTDVAAATRLIIGPWAHAETVTLPGGIRNRHYRLESLAPSLPWFDRLLRSSGPGVQPLSPVRLYVMGANVWRDEQEWPLARAREMSWFLRSSGRANTLSGDGRLSTDAPIGDEPADTFAADPLNPVPTRGGVSLGYGAGVESQNAVEMRDDVLVYSTPPLGEDVEVTGPVSAVLYVATSAPSTDFTAKLVDVHPDGTAYNVSDGVVRRAHQPSATPAMANATPIEIALWPTSMVFRQGHRIRLEVSSSNFPRFDRNPNTGESTVTATATRIAAQAVHHGPRTPSRLVLPVVVGAR
jgi:putative CocE/NonD family hydrolase